MNVIIAQRDGVEVYLVKTGAGVGRILDVEGGTLFREMPLDSLYARGYWVDPSDDIPPVEQLLKLVKEK